jgi:ParB-like chromosome segregation protein Spo0J
VRITWVKAEDVEPMHELVRTYYDQSNYLYLKRVIERDGFNPAFPVRVVKNRRKGVFEAFDGIHRTKVAKDLGISKIPVMDYTEILTRKKAIAEGIKANKTHAGYNPLDLANHLKTLGLESRRQRKGRSRGRPTTVNLALIADLTKMDERLISHYVNLLRLPESVQKLIGEGKLRSSTASLLLKLEKTPSKHLIPELAQKTVAEGWSYRDVLKRVEIIKKKGYYQEDTKLCVGCKRAFPKESMSYPCLCPDCIRRLRSRKLQVTPNRDRTEAKQKFLKVNHFVQKLKKEGKEVPAWLEERLERLHERWVEERGWKTPDLFGD